MHYVSNCSVKNDENTYFMSYFFTSHKQFFLQGLFFLMFYSTNEVRKNLRDVKIIYGCKDRGWV